MLRADSFDERLLRWIDDHRIGALTSFSTTLMDVTETGWVVAASILTFVAAVAYRRAWRLGLAIGVASYAGGFTSGLLKSYFERPRPTFPDALVEVAGYAMPSSHASFSTAASVALLLVVEWKSRRALVLCATALVLAQLLVGVLMVYLGAHWATDVFAGWALGIPIGLLVGLMFRRRQRRPQPA